MKPRRGRPGRNDDERSWLLIKERDKFVRPEDEYDIVAARPESVTTGRGLGEIAAAGNGVWHSAKPPDASGVPGVRKVGRWKTPALTVPTRARRVPAGADWVHELEVEGTRARGEISNGDARLVDGAGRDRTAAWDALAKGLLQLPARIAVLDGIATKLGDDGRGHAADQPDTLYVLDLLRLDDWDLLRVPLTERKSLLERLVGGGVRAGVVRYADHVQGHGDGILREAGRLGARAIVSKRADAPYRPGPRPTKDWRVIACALTKDGAKGSRQGEEAAVVHGARGRAGGASKAAAPERVATTAGASVRQPRRAGEEVVAGVRLTHPERLLFPNAGVTKRELAAYYEIIGPTMLPFVRDRPLTLVRGPQGAGGETFFVKNAGPWAPRELRRLSLHRDREAVPGEPNQAMIIDDIPGLVAMAQMDVLEVHIGNARAARIDKPDQVVFDLDPGPESTFAEVAEGALRVRDVLSAIELASFVKTTGSKGLHVVVPLVPDGGWDELFAFTRAVADAIARHEPRRYTVGLAKKGRENKLFIDYLRNRRGATAVAPYSTRANPDAPIAVPIAWEDLQPKARERAGLRSDHFHVADGATLARRRRDPWAGFGEVRQRLGGERIKEVIAALRLI